MMHRALPSVNSSPDPLRPLLVRHFGFACRCAISMEERSEDFREALSNIARHARSLLQNFNDGNVQPIEQRMLNQRPRDSGAGVLSTQTPSSSQTVNNTSFRNVESTAVAAHCWQKIVGNASNCCPTKTHVTCEQTDFIFTTSHHRVDRFTEFASLICITYNVQLIT